MISVLDEEFRLIKPNEKEIGKLKEETEKITDSIKKSAKKLRIKLEVFIGGSLAKGTIIKKDRYDIDIFVRFDKDEDISEKLEKILKNAKLKAEKVHGSRDYFRINKKELWEIIPVLKISSPKHAKNVTDLSYFHVSYILKEIKKNKNLAKEIMLAKSFCFARKCYGAESYIKGFSGYALELLVAYYKSFLNFVKAMAKACNQLVIDPFKHYKNKQEILLNLNEAKLSSPIVFVDPTFKERNALAALSNETFKKFQEDCKKFLKNPSKKYFEQENINKEKFNLVLKAKTDKQEGDIAGSKLLKFHNLLKSEIEKSFVINNSNFEYKGKGARLYFSTKSRKMLIVKGPPINKPENLLNFKKKHKNVFIKNQIAYAREKCNLNEKKFIEEFVKVNRLRMKQMGIVSLKAI